MLFLFIEIYICKWVCVGVCVCMCMYAFWKKCQKVSRWSCSKIQMDSIIRHVYRPVSRWNASVNNSIKLNDLPIKYTEASKSSSRKYTPHFLCAWQVLRNDQALPIFLFRSVDKKQSETMNLRAPAMVDQQETKRTGWKTWIALRALSLSKNSTYETLVNSKMDCWWDDLGSAFIHVEYKYRSTRFILGGLGSEFL